MIKLCVPTDDAMQRFGRILSSYILPGQVIFLQGELGAGKTTLVRGFLRQLGYQGVVKSPTYTLVEEYDLIKHKICHFDLYRLQDVSELFELGFADYMRADTVSLIEWPHIAASILPAPGLTCQIDVATDERQGRWITLTTGQSAMQDVLNDINKQWTVLDAQVDFS